MKVIGIDPGTATTGYGVIEEGESGDLIAIEYGVILTSAHQPLENRLTLLYDQLNEIVNLHHPECGAVEKLYFQKNVSSAMSVGQARGVAMLVFGKSKLPVSEYNPMEVKLSVCGYGDAGKSQVQQMVQILLNLKELPKPDDASDALAIAICHLGHIRVNQNQKNS